MVLPSLDTLAILKAGILVQTSTTITLLLLGFADPRTRGMKWLAAASALGVAAMAARLPHAQQTGLTWDVPVAVAYSLACFSTFFGLRWFAVRKPVSPKAWAVAAMAVVALVLAFAAGAAHPFAALVLIRLITLSTLVIIIAMLWNDRMRALRRVLRAVSVVIGLILCVPVAMVVLNLCGTTFHQNSLFSRVAVVIVMTAIDFAFVSVYIAENKRRLHDEIRRDALTALHNRLALQESAEREIKCAGFRRPLSLLMLDLDHFKALNDTWGHALGDRALRAVADCLQSFADHPSSADPAACIARLGGEEFAILLPRSSLDAAAALAHRIRLQIEALRLYERDGVASLTVSIGVSTWHHGETEWAPMLRRADVALYQAKHNGRNRVIRCSAPSPSPSQAHGQQPLQQPLQQPAPNWRRFFATRHPTL